MADGMKTYGKKFLIDLLTPLIRQWGREEVLRAISEIHETDTGKNPYVSPISEDKKRSSQKPSAVLIVEKYNLPSEKRKLLLEIAALFDHKAFLPTISDVRNFLEMRGEDVGNMKQRPDAFRKIIKSLVDMPEDGLERLRRGSRHSGPSQLGPLSDTIKAASASAREHNANVGKHAEISGESPYHHPKQLSDDSMVSSVDATRPSTKTSGRVEEGTRKDSKGRAFPSDKDR